MKYTEERMNRKITPLHFFLLLLQLCACSTMPESESILDPISLLDAANRDPQRGPEIVLSIAPKEWRGELKPSSEFSIPHFTWGKDNINSTATVRVDKEGKPSLVNITFNSKGCQKVNDAAIDRGYNPHMWDKNTDEISFIRTTPEYAITIYGDSQKCFHRMIVRSENP